MQACSCLCAWDRPHERHQGCSSPSFHQSLSAAVSARLQIFVEIERARLTRKLARLKEAEGEHRGRPLTSLQEVAVVSPDCPCLLHWGSTSAWTGTPA